MNKMEMKTKIMTQMYLHKMTTSIRQLMKNTQTGTRTSLVAIVVDILFDILLLYKYHSEGRSIIISILFYAPYICEPLSLIKNTVPTRCHLQGKGYELPGVFLLPLCAWAG